MTEQEWLAESRVDVLLPWLQRAKKRQLSARRLRLFGVGCCRLAWRRLTPELRRQVEMAERHADGLVTDGELKRTWQANCKLECDSWKASAVGCLLWGPWMTWKAPVAATRYAANLLAASAGGEWSAQADLLRDIAGNPFRKVVWRPEWAKVNDGQAGKLAEAIYERRSFDRLPILGDALEDAGCTDEHVLDHLRQPGPHTRGCWALDLTLARG
jgi:hypothetical protein